MSNATGGNGEQQRRRTDWQQQKHRWEHPHGRRADKSGVLRRAMAVVLTVLAILVLLAAVSVLLVVLILQPRAPYLAVQSAALDTLVFGHQGVLDDARLSLGVVAANGNVRATASFSQLELQLSFHGTVVAILRADPFVVPPRASLSLAYVVRSSGVPLDSAGQAAMAAALKRGVVPFKVAGQARTRWKVGGVVAVNYWTRLACELPFLWPPNGTVLRFTCNSMSRSSSSY